MRSLLCVAIAAVVATSLVACSDDSAITSDDAPVSTTSAPPTTLNVYADAAAGKLSDVAKTALDRVYVPNRRTNNVSVIDPTTMTVIDVLPVGINPQHVVPSWDMKRLWVANNAEGTEKGSLTPIDPATGKVAGPSVAVDDPYNLYFTPDGAYALVVAEARKRLDFRDPETMELRFSLDTPTCGGINHMDYSIDGSYLIATCEDANRLVKIDWKARAVLATLELGRHEMPQDVRLSPDGKTFYVADMMSNQIIMINGDSFERTGAIDLAPSGGFGAHGLYPSRDGKLLYVGNRGSHARGSAPPRGKGSVSVVDIATNAVVANWPVPDGGSPDMGGVSADGKTLWLSGRFDDEVYAFDTEAGRLRDRVALGPVGAEPHGLAVWPQPGRYSLGHTGNTR